MTSCGGQISWRFGTASRPANFFRRCTGVDQSRTASLSAFWSKNSASIFDVYNDRHADDWAVTRDGERVHDIDPTHSRLQNYHQAPSNRLLRGSRTRSCGPARSGCRCSTTGLALKNARAVSLNLW